MLTEIIKLLDEYATDNEAVLNYWFDSAYESVEDKIKQLSDDEWTQLFMIVGTKSDLWKERLAYCLNDRDNINQFKMLELLLNTKNEELLIDVIDSLRFFKNLDELENMEIIIERLNSLIPKLDIINQKITKDFLNKIETANSKTK